MFDGEMSIKTLTTTLLQIFCNAIFTFKEIVKSVIDPDDNLRLFYSAVRHATLLQRCTQASRLHHDHTINHAHSDQKQPDKILMKSFWQKYILKNI